MKSTQGRSRTKRAGQFEFNEEEPIRVPGFFLFDPLTLKIGNGSELDGTQSVGDGSAKHNIQLL